MFFYNVSSSVSPSPLLKLPTSIRIQRNNLLASPINTALAAPPIAQLVGSSFSLIEAAVHVVNANAVTVPPEENSNKSLGFEQTVPSHMFITLTAASFLPSLN